jgi:hypothetical protein
MRQWDSGICPGVVLIEIIEESREGSDLMLQDKNVLGAQDL